MSLMLEGDDFISACKDYLMLANNSATTDRVHTDLGIFSLGSYRMTIVNIVILVVKLLVYCVCKHDSSA